VNTLFQALSQCSALHQSLLPSGESSNFFGLPNDDDEDDDGAWEDAMDQDGGEGREEGGEGGRVRSDFLSGGGPGARFRPY
jgi:nucleotide-sensitive chloride channel 1A